MSGLSQFQLSYEISPIILVGGIASDVPGGMVPIISLIQAQDFKGGLLSQGSDTSFNDFVGHFSPIPGGTLIDVQYGTYPFANQQVAANAAIFQPLRVSLLMVAPAPAGGGYPQKLTAFTSLQQTLQQHMLKGGTFTVATPAFIYPPALLSSLRDVTSGEGRQVQTAWQWDFYCPLLTLAAAQAAQNSLMSKITGGTQLSGDPPSASGTASSVGDPSSGIAPPLVPAAQNSAGTSVNTGAVYYGVSPQGGPNPAPSTSAGGGTFVPAGPNG